MKIRTIFFSLATLVSIFSCSSPNADWLAEGILPEEPAAKPAYYVAVGDGNMHVLDEHEDVYKANVSCPLAITVGNKIVNAGTEGVTIITKSIAVTATGDYTVRYSVNGVEYSYIAKVSCDVTFEGYTLKPLRSLSVVVEGAGEVVRDTPFYQEFAANNVFMFGDDVVVDEAMQEIAVKEGAAIFDRADLIRSEHQYFIKEAEVKNDTLIIKGVNQATFKEYWKKQASDSTAIIKKEYPLEYRHLISAPNSGVVDDLEAVLNKKIAVKNGKATLGGEWEFVYLETICSKVEHRGVDYTEKVVKCSPEVRTLMALNTETVEICAYEHSEEDCSMVQLPFILKEREPEATLDRVEYNQQHVNFVREAVVSGTVAKVTCNEAMDFVEIFTDGSRRNEEEVSFTIKSTHKVSGLSFEVDDPSQVIGKTYYFDKNGVANIEGNSVTVEQTSKVADKVMYRGNDYTNKVNVHEHTPWTITFISQSEAVVKWYDDDATDYAEATLTGDLREKVTLKELKKSFRHVDFRQDAAITGGIISLVCDNFMDVIKVWSNNTEDAPVSVPYTWKFNFLVNMPEFWTKNMVGQTYYFTDGVTSVENKDVKVIRSSKEISDIMFENQNFKKEAPECQIGVESIRFNDGSADITFVDGEKTIVVRYPVTMREAEAINGKIVNVWATDTYKNRSKVSTDIHVLTESGVVYSRQVGSVDWTSTSLSTSDVAKLTSTGRALAWYWIKDNRELGMVEAIEADRKETGYIIRYWAFYNDSVPAILLGDAESLYNQKPFDYPIHKATEVDGMWKLDVDGEIFYFAGTN